MITVLMPAFNAERFLEEAVQSVRDQTFGDFELLIINDGSTDATGDLAAELARHDGRIRVVSHRNMGMGASLNRGLELARHEWIARLDADDVMLPERLERQMAFVRRHPTIAVASSLVLYIDETGRVLGRCGSRYTSPAAVSDAVRDNVLLGFHHPAVLMRKSVVQEVGGYRPRFWPADDLDLWNRIVEKNHLVLVQPEALTKYRIHGQSVCVAEADLTAVRIDWVEACMLHRRRGEPEPGWEEYSQAMARRSWLARRNQHRKHLARTLYKAAVHHYAARRYRQLLTHLAGGTLLEPSYVLPRVMSGLTSRRTADGMAPATARELR
jgi:glycosyltransferase involved in cell wall biosynthesis